MADGANLDLTISSGLDASVHKSFAVITKLLTKVEKSMGSLNSSMAQIATASDKLAESINSITVAAVKAADKVDKLGDSFVETQEKQKAASKQMKKTSLEQADIHRVTSKQYMTNIRLADQYSQRLAHIDSTVKKTSKEYGLQVSALTKTERAYQNLIKSSDMAVERVAKMEKELAALREERSKFATNSNEALTLDPQIKRLEDRIERIRVLTTEEGHKALVEAFDYDRVFQQNLKKIKKSQIFTETEKHIQKLSEFGDYAVDIYNRLTKSMSDSSAERKIVEKDVTKYVTSLTKELLQLDNDIRSASYSRLNSIGDKETWNKYNERVEMLKAQRAELWESATNPHTAFETYTNRKATVVNEAVAVSRYAQSVHELRKEYGQWAVDIFEDVTVGIDESSRRFKRELDNVKRYGNQYYDELSRIDSKIRTLNHELESPDYSDEKRRSLETRLMDTIAEKNRYIEAMTGSGAVTEYHARRSKLGDETIPISKVTKYTNELEKYGNAAIELFRWLNTGIDENSKKIDDNHKKVDNLFKAYKKKRENINAELLDTDLQLGSVGLSEKDEINLGNKRIKLQGKIDTLDAAYNTANIMSTFAKTTSGLSATFDKWSEIGQKVTWVGKAVSDIQSATVQGSAEQKSALSRLSRVWNDHEKTVEASRQAIRRAGTELVELFNSKAGKEAIDNQKQLIRDIGAANKSVLDSFAEFDPFTTFDSRSAKYKKTVQSLIYDTSYFGKTARSLMGSIGKEGNWGAIAGKIEQLATAYGKVIPVINRFIEANDLTHEQSQRLLTDEFLKEAATNKSTAGIVKAAEAQMGFNKTSRTSITLLDRMASSMGNMARYAFGASIYYAFENAIFSAIDSVAQFDQSLKNLQAITDATDTEVALLGDEIKRVAVQTKYNLKEVAEGATIIGQAGFNATETISILGSAMNLAQGSMSTVTASADLLTTVIAAFNLNASDAAMVADNMAAAMNYSKLDIDKLRTAFNYVGPVAMDAGLSLNEMSAALMVLANNGMKASTIGTSLRNVFSQIASPSTALKTAFENDTEALAKLQDKSTSIVEKFEILNKVLGTSSNLYELFGLRAAGTVSILMKYPGQLQEMVTSLYTLGDAERMANKQMEGFANRLKNLSAATEVAMVTLTERPSGAMSDIVKGMTDIVTGLTSILDSSFGDALTYVTSFGAAATALGLAIRLLSVVVGRTLPKALGIAVASLGAKIVGTTADTAATVANTSATEANTAANAANAASDTASTIANAADTAATVADTTATVANTTATVANTAANAANAVKVGLLTKLFRGLGLALGWLGKHPAFLALTAFAATVGVVTAAVSAFRKEEDEEYKASAKWIKQKQEQLGLLRTAINANRNLKNNDEAIRMSNNIYVATKVPQIATALLDIPNKEETQRILEAEFETIKQQIVEVADNTITGAIKDLKGSADERKRIQTAFKERLAGVVDFDPDALGIEIDEDVMERVFGSPYELSGEDQKIVLEGYQDAMAKTADATQDAYARIRHAVATTAETVAHEVDELIRKHGSARAALDSIVPLSVGKMSGSTVTDTEVTSSDVYESLMIQRYADWEDSLESLGVDLDQVDDKYKEHVKAQMEISVNNYRLARSTVDAASALKELPVVLNSMGLEGNNLVNMFKDVDNGMLVLANAAQKLKKAREDIAEKGLVGEAKIQAEKAALTAFYNELGKGIDASYKREISWIETTRNAALAANKQKASSEIEEKRKAHEINLAFYKKEQEEAKKSVEKQLDVMMKEAGLGKLTPEELKTVFSLDTEALQALFAKYPGLEDILKSDSMQGGIKRVITLETNIVNSEDALSGRVDEITGLRNKLAATANTNAAKNAEAELAYERGQITNRQLEMAKLANAKAELDQRADVLSKVRGELPVANGKIIETTPEYLKYQKEHTDWLKDTAQYERDLHRVTTSLNIQDIKEAERTALEGIDARDTALRTASMNEADRQEQLLALDIDRLEIQKASLAAQYKATSSELEKKELLHQMNEKGLEIDKKRKELSDKIYENSKKNLEQMYNYGIASKEAYQEYIKTQMKEGKIDLVEGQRKLWLSSDDAFDGVKEGLARILDDTRDMNDWIAEGVANFRNEWHSAIDDFVDACWDGTKSAEEIFKDFATNILMDWQKRIIKMYSDQMFDELIKPFFSKTVTNDITSSLGGILGRNAQVATGAISTDSKENVPVATTYKYVDGQLVQSINATAQNIQTSINSATAATTASVEGMATQSTSLITSMTDGATNLWSFLGNGFQSLWGTIGSGMSNMLSMIALSMSSSSNSMSFLERWLTNSIGMGFKLVGGVQWGTGTDVLGGPTGAGTNVVSGLGWNAKGNVFKGLSDFSNSIVSSPTLFTYGEHLKAFAKGAGVMGEAGPEAIMPLTRDSNGRLGVSAEGMGGAQCINNIYIETPEGYTAEQTSRVSNNNGGEDIMFTIVKQTAANVAQPGSPMYRAMQNTFGASQVLTSR